MKRLESWEAAERLLAGDFKGTSEYNLFIYRFIHDMENKYGLNIRISEAEKIYEFFRDIISYKLDPISEEQIGLYDEQPEYPEPTNPGEEPQEDPGTNPEDSPGKPISHNDLETDPLTEVLSKSIGPYKGYVSGSNVEAAQTGEPTPMTNLEKKQIIDMFMKFYDLSSGEADALWTHIYDSINQRKILTVKAQKALEHIKFVGSMTKNR